jgi:hypothetical protein
MGEGIWGWGGKWWGNLLEKIRFKIFVDNITMELIILCQWQEDVDQTGSGSCPLLISSVRDLNLWVLYCCVASYRLTVPWSRDVHVEVVMYQLDNTFSIWVWCSLSWPWYPPQFGCDILSAGRDILLTLDVIFSQLAIIFSSIWMWCSLSWP